MAHSEQIHELAAALAKAQSQLKKALKDSTNPHFRSKYADLTAVHDACREALAANGLAVAQVPQASTPGVVCLETMLLHSSGQWLSGEMVLQPVKNDPQGYGSALTYARRYSLAAMVGVSTEDDDAESASGRGSGLKKSERTRTYEPDPEEQDRILREMHAEKLRLSRSEPADDIPVTPAECGDYRPPSEHELANGLRKGLEFSDKIRRAWRELELEFGRIQEGAAVLADIKRRFGQSPGGLHTSGSMRCAIVTARRWKEDHFSLWLEQSAAAVQQ
ncbi:MAG TPA: ERF family protein [Terracidiphilus sp.]|jgi:hypothetical protein|nr:ERF family protein [Terracidiphilus sp.]